MDRLQGDGGTGGPDLAIVELPHTLDPAARERAIGDYRLNGVPPTDVWKRVFAAQEASQADG